MSSDRRLLRHTLATLAYRCSKTLRDAPDGFSEFRLSQDTRTPGNLLTHISNVLEWALALAKDEKKPSRSSSLSWNEEVARFYHLLKDLDDYLASDAPLHASAEKLFQGPIADALTHTGQLALLRRMAGAAIRGENYFVANIVTGNVGSNQAKAVREFD
jgi:hypothetical protein